MPLEAPCTMETPTSQLGTEDDDDDVAKPGTLILLTAANDGETSHAPPVFTRVFITKEQRIGCYFSDVCD